MAQTQVYVEDPFDRIVNVHFGGGPVVVAEVPQRFAYLLSLNPADPAGGVIGDEQLTFSGTYNENLVIPVDDYTTMPLDTTANIHMGTPIIDGIADTDLLTAGASYKISGTGILPNTTMTYGGGGAGVLSNNGTLEISGASVEIRIKIWEFQVYASNVTFPNGAVGNLQQTQYRIEAECGAEPDYIRGPFVLYQLDEFNYPFATPAEKAAMVDAAYADLLAEGYQDYMLVKSYDGGVIHNGVTTYRYSIFQFWQVFAEFADVFLINMGFAKLVQVSQLVYDEPYFPPNNTGILPGYLDAIGGTKLTAYPPGTQFSLSHATLPISGGPGGFGDYFNLVVKAKSTTTDPVTGLQLDAVPLWVLKVPPTEHPPAAPIEIARFNTSGLVAAPAPALVPA